MDDRDNVRRMQAIRRALELATEAIDLLDALGGPPEAAVHLEMAMQRLRQETTTENSLGDGT